MPRYIDAERFSERFDMMCDAGGVLAPVIEAVREMVKKIIKAEPTADVQSADVEPAKGWISIGDRLPDDDVEVLVYDKYCGVMIGWYEKKNGIFFM